MLMLNNVMPNRLKHAYKLHVAVEYSSAISRHARVCGSTCSGGSPLILGQK